MTAHPVWRYITAFGDSAVILPCIALVAVWLVLPAASRGMAWRWLVLSLGVMSMVAATKLAFMGWMVSLGSLDFTGLSGHATMAAVAWPALGALLGGRLGHRWQLIGLAAGLLFAWLVAWSRLVLHAHSISEVVLGACLGSVGVLVFVRRYHVEWRLPKQARLAVWALLPALWMLHGVQFPSEFLLRDMTQAITAHRAYTRWDLHHPQQR